MLRMRREQMAQDKEMALDYLLQFNLLLIILQFGV